MTVGPMAHIRYLSQQTDVRRSPSTRLTSTLHYAKVVLALIQAVEQNTIEWAIARLGKVLGNSDVR